MNVHEGAVSTFFFRTVNRVIYSHVCGQFRFLNLPNTVVIKCVSSTSYMNLLFVSRAKIRVIPVIKHRAMLMHHMIK